MKFIFYQIHIVINKSARNSLRIQLCSRRKLSMVENIFWLELNISFVHV